MRNRRTARTIAPLAILALGIASGASARTTRTVRQRVDADIVPAVEAAVELDADAGAPRLQVSANTRFALIEEATLYVQATGGDAGAALLDAPEQLAPTLSRALAHEPTTTAAGRAYPLDVAGLTDAMAGYADVASGWHVEIVYTVLPASL